MVPIQYQDAIDFFNEEWTQIQTLGRNSSLYVCVVTIRSDQHLKLRNSGGHTNLINVDHWDLVMRRIAELTPDQREHTSRYVRGDEEPNWPQCPNQVFSPYVPAVVRYVIENRM